MATETYNLRGGRASAATQVNTGYVPQAGVINSAVEGILHMAGIPGTASRADFTTFGGTPTGAAAPEGRNLLADLQAAGFSQSNKGLNQSQAQKLMATVLGRAGVKSLDEIGYVVSNSGPQFYNRVTGKAIGSGKELGLKGGYSKVSNIPGYLGESRAGKGGQQLYLGIGPDGRVVGYNQWEAPEKGWGFLQGALPMVAMLAAPWATKALSGAIMNAGIASGTAASSLAGGIYGGVSGAATNAASGGNIGKGLLGGAVTGALGAGIGGGANQWNAAQAMGINSTGVQQAINAALSGAGGGLVSTALNSGNPMQGALGGALTGVLRSQLGDGPLTGAITRPIVGNLVESIVGNPYQGQIDKAMQAAQRQHMQNQQEIAAMFSADRTSALNVGDASLNTASQGARNRNSISGASGVRISGT